MRLYIIRHADPDYSTDSITEDGHKEAKALAKRLAIHGLDKIYCSPMGRAIITAKYTADLLGINYNIENWTRELWPELSIENSSWGRIMAIDIPGEALRDEDNLNINKRWYESSHLKGCNSSAEETFEKLKTASDEFIARHGYERVGGRYRINNSNQDKIAVFCHGGFGLTWLVHLLEIPVHLMWSGFWLPPTSVTTVLFDERSKEWATPRCLGLGDVSHLYEAGLEIKPRGIIANYY
jgi:probable phosphoglycerate mutase